MNDHLPKAFVHAVDDAIIADTDAIQMFRASQLGRLTRKWFISKCFDLLEDAPCNRLWQCAQVFLNGRLEDGSIGRH
jgi:hypothetical protein